jgi:hypothetical protein
MIMRLAAAAFALLTLGCASTPRFDDLPPLTATGSEVRVHYRAPELDDEWAYVVRADGVTIYEGRGARQRVHTIETPDGADLLREARSLAAFDGQALGCVDTMSHQSQMRFEGVVDGQRFSFTGANMEFCSISGDAETQPVYSWLDMVDAALGDAS